METVVRVKGIRRWCQSRVNILPVVSFNISPHENIRTGFSSQLCGNNYHQIRFCSPEPWNQNVDQASFLDLKANVEKCGSIHEPGQLFSRRGVAVMITMMALLFLQVCFWLQDKEEIQVWMKPAHHNSVNTVALYAKWVSSAEAEHVAACGESDTEHKHRVLLVFQVRQPEEQTQRQEQEEKEVRHTRICLWQSDTVFSRMISGAFITCVSSDSWRHSEQ